MSPASEPGLRQFRFQHAEGRKPQAVWGRGKSIRKGEQRPESGYEVVVCCQGMKRVKGCAGNATGGLRTGQDAEGQGSGARAGAGACPAVTRDLGCSVLTAL